MSGRRMSDNEIIEVVRYAQRHPTLEVRMLRLLERGLSALPVWLAAPVTWLNVALEKITAARRRRLDLTKADWAALKDHQERLRGEK